VTKPAHPISFLVLTVYFAAAAFAVCGQTLDREISIGKGQTIEVVNLFGRIDVTAIAGDAAKGSLTAVSTATLAENEVTIVSTPGRLRVEVKPASSRKRIDLRLNVSERSRLGLTTGEGEVMVVGNFESITARTETGTIAVDVPVENIRYSMLWTASRPRFVSDFELEKVKERAAGRFEIKGNHVGNETTATEPQVDTGETPKQDDEISREVILNFTTARGIVLINVPPNEVTGDLRERPLTEAAKAIIRSGDTVMMDAIRRAAPKFFGDYARTLPPLKREPELAFSPGPSSRSAGVTMRATVTITDQQNRALAGLRPSDFEVLEDNRPREIISVRPVQAPVNLVLLLDVSGSIENYVTFIRKAAREFVNTVDEKDRISIVLFGEDVKVLAGFTTDKRLLSESLDTFDAGGATAYYDALGYAISESLRPLKGDRTAIVVLTDGDDNRSFLAFDSLIGAIEESGALIYPLYVPSSLIAASAANGFRDIDPLRNRHLTLTSKANGEGERLAKVSGGVYYPISQLSQINTAYQDIVVQLRTAYDITYRSELSDISGSRSASPRLRIKVKRPNAFVQLGPVVPAGN